MGDDGELHLSIIDYNQPKGLTATEVTGFGAKPSGAVSTEIGDFDGDGINEVAVVYASGGTFQVIFVSYDSPDQTQVAKSSSWSVDNQPIAPAGLAGAMTTTSGDLLGTGRDTLAVIYHRPNPGAQSWSRAWVKVLTFGAGFAETGSTDYDTGYDEALKVRHELGDYYERGPALVAALLDVGANAAAPNPARRQLMLGVPVSGDRNCYRALKVDHPAGGNLAVAPLGAEHCAAAVPSEFYPGSALQPIQLAAGGFAGRAAETGSLPRWGVATLAGGTARAPKLTMLGVKDGVLSASDLGATAGEELWAVALTAFDQKNETLRLGAPVVVEMQNLQTPTMVVAAPPSHVDWIYNASKNKDTFINVSASQNLAIAMSDTATASYTSATTTTAGGSVSSSASVSVGQTVSGDVGVFAAKESSEFKLSASGAIEGAKTSASEHTSTKTTSQRSRTVSDDLLRLKISSQRIFRYPILGGNAVTPEGAPCGQQCAAYYDVYIPTDSAQATSADVGGRTVDGYTPSWQNGNALSYPTSRVEKPGEWSFVNDNGETVTKSEDILTQEYRLGGDSSDTTLSLTSIDNSSHKSEVKGTLTQGVDWKASASATFSEGVAKEKFQSSAEISVKTTESFSHTTTGSTTTTSTAGLELLAPAVATGGYDFTLFYYYLGGASKVNYTVDLGHADNEFWQRNYGRQPDPALSLPNAILLENNGSKPEFSTEFARQEIRGFRALQTPEGTQPKDAKEYTTAPRTGDPVTFAVDVRNFSLMPTVATKVEFFAVPVNPATMDPTGAPVPIGAPISVPSIGARGTQTAYSPTWTAVGPASQGQSQAWNVFVVLNRDGDSTAEIHPHTAGAQGGRAAACATTRGSSDFAFPSPGTVDAEGFLIDPMTGKRDVTACGGNNQGYGSITVLGKSTSARVAAADVVPANVQLTGAGFITEDPAHANLDESSSVPTLVEGVATSGVVRAGSDANSTAHQLVMVYDGDPDQGGTLIASTTLQGTASESGGYARYSWTPTGVGEHKLYQKIYGSSSAGSSDAQIVTVNVVAQPVDPGEPTPTPTPTAVVPGGTDPTGAPAARPDGSLPNTGGSLPVLAIVLGAAALLIGALLLTARLRSRRGRNGGVPER